jgi:Uma2 family endonuclease
MSTAQLPRSTEAEIGPEPPDHLHLPDKDESVMETYLELPQANLLTSSLWPILHKKFPGRQFAIGGNSGIYWRWTDPPLRGAICPDWFLVPDVDPFLVEGARRRSYVLWKEHIPPLIVLEFVSGDGTEERDRTPIEGKFWIYEQGVHAGFYGIFEPVAGHFELYQRIGTQFRAVAPNARDHYPVEPLGLELGVWIGRFQDIEQPWLRWWDDQGKLLLTGDEAAEAERRGAEAERQRAEAERQRAEAERQRAEAERQRAEAERQRAEALATQLRALGVEPNV